MSVPLETEGALSAPPVAVDAFPPLLTAICAASIAIGVLCAVLLGIDVVRRPQPVRIMNAVWPLTALFGGIPWLAFYLLWARAPRPGGHARPARSDRPRAVGIAISTSHCGAGCSLADLIVEWLVFAVPALAVLGGLHLIFDERIFATWVLDFVAAFLIGIAFQYAAVRSGRSRRDALTTAIRADAASIAAWQLGMYGAMAIAQFAIFAPLFGAAASVATPEFWFAMQWAMIVGFATAFPVNALLIRKGVKEAM